jgi:hypothetical protein
MGQAEGPEPKVRGRVGDAAQAVLNGVDGLMDKDVSEVELKERVFCFISLSACFLFLVRTFRIFLFYSHAIIVHINGVQSDISVPVSNVC